MRCLIHKIASHEEASRGFLATRHGVWEREDEGTPMRRRRSEKEEGGQKMERNYNNEGNQKTSEVGCRRTQYNSL